MVLIEWTEYRQLKEQLQAPLSGEGQSEKLKPTTAAAAPNQKGHDLSSPPSTDQLPAPPGLPDTSWLTWT